MPDTAPAQGESDRPLFENDDGGRGLGPTLGGDLGETPLPPGRRAPASSSSEPKPPAAQETGPVPGEVIAPDGVAPAYGVGPSPGFDQPDRSPIDADFRARGAQPGPQSSNEQEGELRDQARAQSRTRAPAHPDARQVETDGADPLPDDNDAL